MTPGARSEIVNRLTERAWRDARFRELLFDDPGSAMTEEFGGIPDGLENVSFRRAQVDRATVQQMPNGKKKLVVRPKPADRLINVLSRDLYRRRELIVIFYTKRCQYQCSFCTLPSTSAFSDVSFADVDAQLRQALEYAKDELDRIGIVSLGNEGSILDRSTLTKEQMEHLLKALCGKLPALGEVVLETRAEFVDAETLDHVLECIAPRKLVVKIGLESVDDHIRNTVLSKKMDLADFERAVMLLGQRGVKLASYVIIKADPAHTDEEGRKDAIATCEYLKNVARRYGVELSLRINTMYRAKGSIWARHAEELGWVPPSIFDLAEVLYAVRSPDITVYAGLYDEGLATADGHYEARPDYEPWALEMLERYNQTEDFEILRQVAEHRKNGSKPESVR